MITWSKRNNVLKTIVVHPKDPTTDFLTKVYENLNCTVIRSCIPPEEVVEGISSHDRIIMLGHGIESGLFCGKRLIINDRHVKLLKDKRCFYIWCNADRFVNENNLSGFHTGMFISDMEEAKLYNVNATLDDINKSNLLFAAEVKTSIESNDILGRLSEKYDNPSNPVVVFNRDRLYYS